MKNDENISKITSCIIKQIAEDKLFTTHFIGMMDMKPDMAASFITKTAEKCAIIIRNIKKPFELNVIVSASIDDFYKRIRIDNNRDVIFSQDCIPIPMTNEFKEEITMVPGYMVISEMIDSKFVSKVQPITPVNKFAYVSIMKSYNNNQVKKESYNLIFVNSNIPGPNKLMDKIININ